MPNREAREESSVIKIWLAAVTAVVFTTNVEAPVGRTIPPVIELPQTAGVADELQSDPDFI
jgi:hypothetical protein